MLRLLIVDDEDIIRQSLSTIIDYESMGLKLIGTAANGVEGFGIIQDEYPDVVITDLKMPVMGGLELIERTEKIDKNVEFIILSGYGEFEYAKEAMKYGVRYYLTKPTKISEFKSVLKEIVEKRGNKNMVGKNEKLINALKRNFLIEAVEFFDIYDEIYKKYMSMEIFAQKGITLIYIHFLEEKNLKFAMEILRKYLEEHSLSLYFPAVYVKNTLILPTSYMENTFIDKYGKGIINLLGEQCEAVFESSMDEKRAIKTMIKKISRYKRIFINFAESDNFLEIGNKFFVSAANMARFLKEKNDINAKAGILEDEFAKDLDLDELKVFCINVYLQMKENENSLNGMAFFKNVYLCEDKAKLLELMKKILEYDFENEREEIRKIKEYVDLNIDTENLSLKWIAENILFINVDYLSKLFVREEKMRFSEFVNSKKMELAISIMNKNKEVNIKDIANQVGFGNNPRYFGQVFKKYIGVTPSEYMENKH